MPIGSSRRGPWHEPELWDELVDVYEQLGRTDAAIAAMRSAIAAGWRGRPDGRCRIAELLMRAGRVDEAAPLWDQVRAEDPDDVWLYNNAGLEYADVGDDATALTWLTDGLELALATGDPEHLVDQLLNLRGASLSRVGRPADRLQSRAHQFLDRPAPARRRSTTPCPHLSAPRAGATRRPNRPRCPHFTRPASPPRRPGQHYAGSTIHPARRNRTVPFGRSRWPGSRPTNTRRRCAAGRS